MKYYRVGVFASVSVRAENEDDAIHQVKKSVIDGCINIYDYEFEAQDRELDPDLDFLETMAQIQMPADSTGEL